MSDLEITMLIQKFAEENDLYSKEVRNLLSEGGVERLISQYKNISRRLDNISDENKALKRHIADLESKSTVELPFDALETANYLINATYEVELDGLSKAMEGTDKINRDRYSIDELEQIAEYLLVYCKHNKT